MYRCGFVANAYVYKWDNGIVLSKVRQLPLGNSMGLTESIKNLNRFRFCRNASCGRRFFLKFDSDKSRYCDENCHMDHLKFRAIRKQERLKNKPTQNNKNKRTSFYFSKPWLILRYDTLKRLGRVCKMCGATPPTKLHVDHIVPRSKAPHRALDPTNLQILCASCNMGKLNRDEIAW